MSVQDPRSLRTPQIRRRERKREKNSRGEHLPWPKVVRSCTLKTLAGQSVEASRDGVIEPRAASHRDPRAACSEGGGRSWRSPCLSDSRFSWTLTVWRGTLTPRMTSISWRSRGGVRGRRSRGTFRHHRDQNPDRDWNRTSSTRRLQQTSYEASPPGLGNCMSERCGGTGPLSVWTGPVRWEASP